MYVGRILGVGRNRCGDLVAAYRVSSRSFPNREANKLGNSVRVVALAGSADAASESPYIAYECLIWNNRFSVVSNGTHTRPIFERLKTGSDARDAIASVLVGLDREFDEYDTPRICGVVDRTDNSLWLGSITAKSLSVMPIEISESQMAYITTYEFPLPEKDQLDIVFNKSNAIEVCHHITSSSVFSNFEKPICAVASVATAVGFDVATLNISPS